MIQTLEIEKEEKLEKYDNDIEYLMSTLGFAAGFGSIWRFPYISKHFNKCIKMEVVLF